MSAMPHYPQDENALLKLSKAHEALDKANAVYLQEYERLTAELAQKHNPFIYMAQSVLYEALGNAAMAGFSRDQMYEVMDCDGHI
jgi:hypothetical protein